MSQPKFDHIALSGDDVSCMPAGLISSRPGTVWQRQLCSKILTSQILSHGPTWITTFNKEQQTNKWRAHLLGRDTVNICTVFRQTAALGKKKSKQNEQKKKICRLIHFSTATVLKEKCMSMAQVWPISYIQNVKSCQTIKLPWWFSIIVFHIGLKIEAPATASLSYIDHLVHVSYVTSADTDLFP